MNLAEALELHAQARPRHPAIVAGPRTLDHASLAARVRETAGRLSALGLGRGDLVGLSLRDTVEHVVLLYALARRGVVILPMDWRWTAGESERVAGHFGARTVVREADAGPLDGLATITVEELMAVDPVGHDAAIVPGADLPLLLSLSSGTTGRPKGPLIDHSHMLRRFWTHWINLGLSSADRYLAATPLYFGGGRSFAMSILFSGGTLILFPPPFEAAELCAEAERTDASATFLVPTQLRRLLELPADVVASLGRLDLLMSSGAPLDPGERRAIRERLCPNFVEYYGSTEGGGISYSTPAIQEREPTSVGWPVFAVEVEVVDEDHRQLPRGTIGRLRYRGPGVASSFHGEDEGQESFRDGFFYPGDLAEISEEGLVFLRGRVKDVIIRGGVNVHPAEVEEVLRAHPAVAEAAVAGRPSQALGEDVAAFVVLRDEADPVVLLEWCRQRLAPYKVPREIVVVPDLPRNSSGKVLKARLLAGPEAS